MSKLLPFCGRHTVVHAIFSVLLLIASPVAAQNMATSTRDWHGAWGFQSISSESLALTRAKLIEEQNSGALAPSSSFITYDNRSNYLEINGDVDGPVDAVNRIGDDIGRNTNVVGAMNTGSNTIEVTGSGNVIEAVNAADSAGCLNGSINEGSASEAPAGSSALAGILAEAGLEARGDFFQSVDVGSSQSGCVP